MKEKILALLTTKYPGVRKDGLKQLARTLALQVTTEEDATTAVDKLNDAQVNEFVKEYRADVDKEVSEGNKTFEMNLRKKMNLDNKIDEPGDDDANKTKGGTNGGGDNMATLIANAVANAIKPLQDKIESYEKNDVVKSRLQQLNEKLSTCKDDNFRAQALKDFGRMNFNSDDEFSEYLTEKETAIATANQNMADAALGSQGKPFFAQKEESGISKGVAEYVASQTADNTPLSGKEV